jgi:5-bromo-4-chloroindolyl phosphate hydrolysis protein
MAANKNLSFIFIIIILLILNIFYFLYFTPPFLFSVIVLVVDFAAIVFWFTLIKHENKVKISKDINFQEIGITSEMVESFVNDTNDRLGTLKEYKGLIKNDNVKNNIEEIAGILQKIIDDIQKDPVNLNKTKRFLAYYLDTAIKIIKKYYELSKEENLASEDLKKSLTKVESILDSLRTVFKTHYQKLLDNDVLDLDAELEVLEKTIKMESTDYEKN